MGNMILHEPKYWRDRAEEARAIAEDFRGTETCRTMLEIASTYDYLAMQAAKVAYQGNHVTVLVARAVDRLKDYR